MCVLVVLDKAHAAHIRGQLIHRRHAARRAHARIPILQVERQAFHAVRHLVPLVQRLDIDRAYNLNPICNQMLDQMPADKPAGAANDCLFPFEAH